METRDYIVVAVFVGLSLLWLAKRYRKYRSRQALMARGLDTSWVKYLRDNVALYRKLPRQYHKQFHGHINIFLAEKSFIGNEGLVVTDEVRINIAAQACLLLLNRKIEVYPNFHTVMVYPAAFYSMMEVNNEGIISNEKVARVGESWQRGIVVLSWDDAKKGGYDYSDGQNVVIHEFAHRLDQQNTDAEGVPVMDSALLYEQWASVLEVEFDALREHVSQGRDTLIDAYGAISPAEFFAVVTELFFELPRLMSLNHPELYEKFSEYYCLDPAKW